MIGYHPAPDSTKTTSNFPGEDVAFEGALHRENITA